MAPTGSKREAFDLYSIVDSHNDLRRILTDYGVPLPRDFQRLWPVEMALRRRGSAASFEAVTI